MSLIEASSLKKLIRKALVFNLMNNLNTIIKATGLSHRELSERAGQSSNWFNDAFNNSEDITISSLSKVFGVLDQDKSIEPYPLMVLFDKKIILISNTLSRLADEDQDEQSIKNFILINDLLFSDMLTDWGALIEKKKLTTDEKSLYLDIQRLLSN